MINFTTLTVSDSPRLGFIQVKDGLVRALNEHVIVQFPVDEVFGPGLIEVDEEFYFGLKFWNESKLHTARSFKRDGNSFTGYNSKKKEIATIIGSDWLLPDPFPVVIPPQGYESKNPIFRFAMDLDKLNELTGPLGTSCVVVTVDAEAKTSLHVQTSGTLGNVNGRGAVAGLSIVENTNKCFEFTSTAIRTEAIEHAINDVITKFGEKEALDMFCALVSNSHPEKVEKMLIAIDALSDAMGEDAAIEYLQSLTA